MSSAHSRKMNLCPAGQEMAGCWVVKTLVTLESSYLAAGRDDRGKHGVSGLDLSVHLSRNAWASCSISLRDSSSGAFGDRKTTGNLTKAQTHAPSSQCPQKLDTFPGTVRLVEVFLPVCPVAMLRTHKHKARTPPSRRFPETATSTWGLPFPPSHWR